MDRDTIKAHELLSVILADPKTAWVTDYFTIEDFARRLRARRLGSQMLDGDDVPEEPR